MFLVRVTDYTDHMQLNLGLVVFQGQGLGYILPSVMETVMSKNKLCSIGHPQAIHRENKKNIKNSSKVKFRREDRTRPFN